MPRPASLRSRQRGTTLLEGLVAFLVLSLGMLSVVRVQSQLRLNSDVARQRSEAVRLAQEDLEKMRAFSVIAARAGAQSYATLTNASSTIDASTGQPSNTSYALSREITPGDAPNSKNATVSVSWNDRTGTEQRVVLTSVISGSDPAYSGALKVIPRLQPVRGVRNRSPFIPHDAADLGNGSSAFKPLTGAGVVLVFDNVSGAINARCNGVDVAVPTAQLRVADLRSCETLHGTLLSGIVRFSDSEPPDAQAANDVPPGLAVTVTLAGNPAGASSSCSSEARKTVAFSVGGIARTEGLPLAATAASMSADAWRETGERYVAYHCLVVPGAPGTEWSGRSSIVPAGWTLGTGPLDRRVCRILSDQDRSGAVDANLEHPDTYSAVRTSLTNQNFLIVKGSQPCPAASNGAGAVADLGTAPHQP
jgi:type IV pilus modification protein PilV